MPEPISAESRGRCWSCGYLLVGIDSHRCPECGREFDPHDPHSMNLGKHLGHLAKVFLGGPGWWTALIVLLGTGLIAFGTGIPVGWSEQFEDWTMARTPFVLDARSHTLRWKLFSTGFFIASVGFSVSMLWLLGRQVAIWFHRPPPEFRRSCRRPVLLILVCTLIGVLLLRAGGSRRITREWAETARPPAAPTTLPAAYLSYSSADTPPLSLTPEAELRMVRGLVFNGENAKQKRYGLKFLIERHIDSGASILKEAIAQERDLELLVLQLRLLALYRDVNRVDFLAGFLDDSRAEVRVAALDGIAIQSGQSFFLNPSAGTWMPGPREIAGNPTINIEAFVDRGPSVTGVPRQLPHHWIPPRPALHQRIVQLMLNGATIEEREAAARFMVAYPPPNYRLRLAEWGVWTHEEGEIKLARELSAEIPPFVHHTGNSVAEMIDREDLVASYMPVWKPVVHFTASRPMAVDYSVAIQYGRPWVAYPLPDDFTVESGHPEESAAAAATRPITTPYLLKPFDDPRFSNLGSATLRVGFPWMQPSHRAIRNEGGVSLQASVDTMNMGLQWQSLIISPAKLSWMNEPSIGAGTKYEWWKRLRDVECSWISSRGESERFLYYDGPTRLKFGARPTLENGKLVFHAANVTKGWPLEFSAARLALRSRQYDARGKRRSLLVECRSSLLRAQVIPRDAGSYPLFEEDEVLVGNGVIGRFREELLSRGLTGSEADGLVDCWREMFFQRPGMRLLTFLTPQDYDAFCPMTITPRPTTITRVGVFMTEFKEPARSSTTKP